LFAGTPDRSCEFRKSLSFAPRRCLPGDSLLDPIRVFIAVFGRELMIACNCMRISIDFPDCLVAHVVEWSVVVAVGKVVLYGGSPVPFYGSKVEPEGRFSVVGDSTEGFFPRFLEGISSTSPPNSQVGWRFHEDPPVAAEFCKQERRYVLEVGVEMFWEIVCRTEVFRGTAEILEFMFGHNLATEVHSSRPPCLHVRQPSSCSLH